MMLGDYHFYAVDKEKNYKLAASMWKKGAEMGTRNFQEFSRIFPKMIVFFSGDDGSQYRLGLCYLNGDGVEEDAEAAVYWFERASDSGHSKAQYMSGFCYEVIFLS